MDSYHFPTNIELHQNKDLVLNKDIPINNCKFCNFQVRNSKPNSSKRDLVIACAIGKAISMIIFIKTLRTTGCKANCVLLLDEVAYHSISDKTRDIVVRCGGQIINCGHVPYTKPYDPHSYCHVFAYEFIEANKEEIDRIIICNLYDTVFQGDPFTERFVTDGLNLVDEGSRLNSNRRNPNRRWLEKYNFTEYHNSDVRYVCGGYIGGTTYYVSKALKIFLMTHIFGLERVDQGALNYLYLSGTFFKNGIRVVTRRKDEPVRHIAGSRLKRPALGSASCINNEKAYATIIHHYYMQPRFKNSILKACPMEFPDLENYIR